MSVRVPLWVRVSGLIALTLALVVVGSMLLGGSGGQTAGDHSGPPTGSAVPSHVRPTH